MAKNDKGQDESSFAELERIEDKHIINLSDANSIRTEVEKALGPAYPDPDTNYVLISTTYLDSPQLDFFKHHAYGMLERMKVRIRKYAPNGKWDNANIFLEIKEKEHEDVRKYRIQLDMENLRRVKSGLTLQLTDQLSILNEPLYTHSDLRRYIEKYNKIAIGLDITPVLTVTYRRLAFGKGALRVTLDTNISYKPERVISLSNAYKIKKSVDWKEVKEYGKKYDPKQNAVLEVKHDSALPAWLQKILDDRGLKPEKFSKYVYSAYNMISNIVGD